MPSNYMDSYENLKIRRMEKHLAYRNKLKQEILDIRSSIELDESRKYPIDMILKF
jgi:hypothetical protein